MARLRPESRQLVELLANSRNPVYALDDRRQVVYCNAACEEWLGIDRQELLGQRCDYHSGTDSSDAVSAAICPPPETFIGEPAIGRLIWHDPAGVPTQRVARFSPLGSEVSCLGVLTVVSADDEPSAPVAPSEAATSSDLHQRLQLLAHRHAKRFRLGRLVGESPIMQRVREQVRIAAETTARVSIVGPRGIGREHLGRTIHSSRASTATVPLLPLSCAILDATVLHSTLLAFLDRCGASDANSPGTVLLLDCDQLSSESQAELMGFLSLPTVELHTVATSSRPLLESAAAGEFDQNLALLLSDLVIELPALHARREDIPVLAQQILEQCNSRGDKQLGGFSPEVLNRLGAMPWERNIEELAEVIDEAFRSAGGPLIQEADLPERVGLLISAAAHPLPEEETIELDQFLAEVERELIQRALGRAQGNKAKAARLLGIQRSRLLRRMAQLEIEPG